MNRIYCAFEDNATIGNQEKSDISNSYTIVYYYTESMLFDHKLVYVRYTILLLKQPRRFWIYLNVE